MIAVGLVFGPLCGFVFILEHRKRRARERRRSPLSSGLLRYPAASLIEQIEERHIEFVLDAAFLWLALTLPLAVMKIAESLFFPTTTWSTPACLAVSAAFFAYRVPKLLRVGAHLDQLRLGADAEMAAGQELDQLMRQGALVFHDFPAGGFNIDHVVISDRGVFAVETKGFSKPRVAATKAGVGREWRVRYDGSALHFPEFKTSEPLEQAQRQARWLARWLSDGTGEQVWVEPVVALPGWYVERSGRAAVHVFSGKEIQKYLLAIRVSQRPSGTSQVQRLARLIDDRCRSATPRYKE